MLILISSCLYIFSHISAILSHLIKFFDIFQQRISRAFIKCPYFLFKLLRELRNSKKQSVKVLGDNGFSASFYMLLIWYNMQIWGGWILLGVISMLFIMQVSGGCLRLSEIRSAVEQVK